jgi:Fe-S-cluster-containing hydrogenase component 2
MDCICKKEKAVLQKGCTKPMEVCMGIAPVPGVFDKPRVGRKISKEEAYGVLQKSEEAGLVHLTWNLQSGQYFICNCCGCCCGVLRGINELKIPAAKVVNSHYYAAIDPDTCQACGTCANERCQVSAIEEGRNAYQVIRERCIGCGLCVTTCPSGAIQLKHKGSEELVPPPVDEMAWYEARAAERGIDISSFK